MANPLATLLPTSLPRVAGSFDTFSSYGVSPNSPLSSNITTIGKSLLSSIIGKTFKVGSFTGDGPIVGMVNGDGGQLDGKYRVSIISSSLKRTITAYLQDRVNIKVSSRWEPLVPFNSGKITTQIEKGLQSVGGSLQNKVFARRMWAGTDPITMNISLVFEALSDPFTEVVMPCMSLLQIASPGSVVDTELGKKVSAFSELLGKFGTVGNLGKSAIDNINNNFLVPPGPYPFYTSDDDSTPSSKGDDIFVYIGEYLEYRRVIISSVEVDFDTRINRDGYPIGAKANVYFQTHQVLDKSDIAKVFSPSKKLFSNSSNLPSISLGGANLGF